MKVVMKKNGKRSPDVLQQRLRERGCLKKSRSTIVPKEYIYNTVALAQAIEFLNLCTHGQVKRGSVSIPIHFRDVYFSNSSFFEQREHLVQVPY